MSKINFKQLAIPLTFLLSFSTVINRYVSAKTIEQIDSNLEQYQMAQSEDSSQYIGWQYQSSQLFLKNLRLAGIGTANLVASEYNALYDVSGWLDTKNDRLILFFAQRIGPNRQSKTNWKVIDALSLSLNEFDLSVVDNSSSTFKIYRSGKYSLVGMCFLNNRLDNEIMAMVKEESFDSHYRNIKKAWRANRKTKKFEEISTQGIYCNRVG